tara:strand:+ start:105 stop:956 length:852 start_codon:yes stop_codon:yes gene_type:complete
MDKIYLVSFASYDLKRSVNRFVKQSKEINLYENTKVYRFDDLSINKKNQIDSFFKKGNKRLFGYACWKPEIILKGLKEIPENSILQYSDIGCHLNKNGYERLKYYLSLVDKNEILAFQYNQPQFHIKQKIKFQIYYENEYTKEDLFDYFKILPESDVRYSEQICSGIIFFKNNKRSRNFLKQWDEVCNISNLIDDTPSAKQNSEKFIEHRHDQSAFSILCKINNIVCLSASECEWAEDEKGRYWDHLINYPILAKRDKKTNILKRFFLRQIKNFNRILKKCKI